MQVMGRQSSMPIIFKEFALQLDQLDPSDFEPAAQYDFIVGRAEVRECVTSNADALRLANFILPLLDHYKGQGAFSDQRDFSFINAADVRAIVERDYRELTLRAFPSGSWKSSAVLAGSILEAILYDQLVQNHAATLTAPRVPQRNGVPKDIRLHNAANRWKLEDMINVASDLGIISQSNEHSIDEVHREYRNYVHPKVEIAKGIPIGKGQAMSALGGL